MKKSPIRTLVAEKHSEFFIENSEWLLVYNFFNGLFASNKSETVEIHRY